MGTEEGLWDGGKRRIQKSIKWELKTFSYKYLLHKKKLIVMCQTMIKTKNVYIIGTISAKTII